MQLQQPLVTASAAPGAWPLQRVSQPPAGDPQPPGCAHKAAADAGAFDRSSGTPEAGSALTDAAATPPCGPAGDHGGGWAGAGVDGTFVWSSTELTATAASSAELMGNANDGAPTPRPGEGGAQQPATQLQQTDGAHGWPQPPGPHWAPVAHGHASVDPSVARTCDTAASSRPTGAVPPEFGNNSPLPPAAAEVNGGGWGDGWGHPPYPAPYPYAWPWLPRPRCQPRYGPAAAPYPPPYPPYRHTWTGALSSRPYGPHPPTARPPFAPLGPPPHFPYAPYPPRAGPLRPWPHHMAPPLAPYGTASTGASPTVQMTSTANPSPFATAAVASHAPPVPHPSSETNCAASPQASVRRASSAPFSPRPASTSGTGAGWSERAEHMVRTAGWAHQDAQLYAQPHSGSTSQAPPLPVVGEDMRASISKRPRLGWEGGAGSGVGGSGAPLLPALAHHPEANPAASSALAVTRDGHRQPLPPSAHAPCLRAASPPAAAATGPAAMPQQQAPDVEGNVWDSGDLDWDSGLDLDLDLDLEAFLLGEAPGQQAAGADAGAEAGYHVGPARLLTADTQALTALAAGPAPPPRPRAASEPRGPSPAPETSPLGPVTELRSVGAAVRATTAVPHAPPAAAMEPESSGWAAQGPLQMASPDAAPTPPPEALPEQPPLPKPVRVTVTVAAGEAPAAGSRHSGRRRRRGGGGGSSDEEYDGEGDEDGRRSLAEAAMVGGRVVGVFHPAPYLEGGRCIELEGAMLTRSAFERVGGSNMAKWYRSIKVLPEGCTLGRWLTRHGLPVLKGVPRNGKARLAAHQGVGADEAGDS
ncbi:hypothetical protein HYH03_017378 [Edaphochlamys debaryana]|uniref:Uncharacterized protein n=1 Tax=Edaphochlamys debaryana TaxID=47281 RepID=A0A835XFT4_9CHLO|nr:hypothetical protein HYH03_017378 [Edaphochlamys debaryana]|eukprot:KAG2483782.1 hypothetical protein HYH03_017378 [Edaphochlamys debaryana]